MFKTLIILKIYLTQKQVTFPWLSGRQVLVLSQTWTLMKLSPTEQIFFSVAKSEPNHLFTLMMTSTNLRQNEQFYKSILRIMVKWRFYKGDALYNGV